MLKLLDEALLNSCSDNDRMDIKTAASEACLNAMEHGNGYDPGLNVIVSIGIAGDTVSVEVCDHGEGAELYSLAGNSGPDNEKPGGLGLYIINGLTDKWEYSYNPKDKLFCVRMYKKINEERNGV